MHKISKLGVLTSGGDAPGMNPCIRAVVRTGIYSGLNLVGIRKGYQGLIENDMYDMTPRSVSNILNLGGTILKTARCLPFRTDEGMEAAYQNLKKQGIDALVVIGGDGTFTGALRFSKKYPDIRVMGVPGTIDNDLYGSTYTLGFDTATNTVVGAILLAGLIALAVNVPGDKSETTDQHATIHHKLPPPERASILPSH